VWSYVLVTRPGAVVKCPSSHGTRNSPLYRRVRAFAAVRRGPMSRSTCEEEELFMARQARAIVSDARPGVRECDASARTEGSHRHERRNLRSYHPCMQMRRPHEGCLLSPPASPPVTRPGRANGASRRHRARTSRALLLAYLAGIFYNR